MSRTESIELASTPHGEDCAQYTSKDDGGAYAERARKECRVYRRQLLRVIAAAGKVVPGPDDGFRLFTKANAQDGGSYYEVAAKFPEGDEAAGDLACWLQENQPEKWDAEAHAELEGAACDDEGTGACRVCGVSLVVCGNCEGRGYHRAGCVEIEVPRTIPEGDADAIIGLVLAEDVERHNSGER